MKFKKIFVQDNFLSKIECKKLIQFYNSKPFSENFNGTYPLNLKHSEHNNLYKKINTISRMLNKSIIDWFQIVKWPMSHSGKNLHFDGASLQTTLSSIIYLNNTYDGGHTYFEDGTSFAPVTGRVIFFDGNYYKHGVSSVKNNDRYTVASWFKNEL